LSTASLVDALHVLHGAFFSTGKKHTYLVRIFFLICQNDFPSAVGAAMFPHNDFKIKVGALHENAFKAFCNVFFMIVGCDSNADKGLHESKDLLLILGGDALGRDAEIKKPALKQQ
jgi:hypothetical protein